MRVRLSLSAKVRLLVLLPLCMQLVFLILLGLMHRHEEEQLAKTLKAKEITETVNRLTRDIYATGAAFADPSALDTLDQEETEVSILKAQIEHDGDMLKSLTKDDPVEYRRAIQAKKTYLDALQVLMELKQLNGEKSVISFQQRIALYAVLRKKLKQMVQSGLLIEENQRRVAAQNMQQETLVRNLFHGTALTLGIFNLVVVGWIAIFFTKNISHRLRLLSDNAYRLASNVPLNPVLKSNDEIGKVDMVFHRMAKAMREAARKENAIIEQARDLICSIDSAGKMTAVNPASQAILGRSPAELIGTHFGDLMIDGRDSAMAFLAELKRAGDMPPVEMSLKRADGETVYALLSSHWAEDQGAAFIVIHDISDRKRTELLRKEVVAMITHDLRTPLTTFGTVLRFLKSGEFGQLDPRGKEYLDIGTRNVKRMNVLVNDMLDIEKIDSGEMKLEWGKVLLDEAFDECLDGIGPLAEASGVSLNITPAPYVVAADYEKLQRILVNLLANAIKFSPPGKSITVSAYKQAGFVQIAVKDQGKGIPADQLANVFKRFKQVESKPAPDERKNEPRDERRDKRLTPGSAPGSGLGLTICKAFVELHGGTIAVESQIGVGTEFTFTLPIEPPAS
jgi:PAS domain S-box-containing protein